MKINLTSNGKGRGLGTFRAFLDFFFPYPRFDKNGTGIIRCEMVSSRERKNKQYNQFYTFRAFFLHNYYVYLINPLRDMAKGAEFAYKMQPQRGAIAYDTTTGQENGPDQSITHTATGTNLVAIIGAMDTPENLAATYGGSAATEVSHILVPTNNYQYMWYFNAPPTGASTVTYTGGGTYDIMSCSTFSGCKQTSAVIDSSATNSGSSVTTFTLTTTVVASNCWLVACSRNTSGSDVTISGQGSIRLNESGAVGGIAYDSNGTVGTGAQSLVFTQGSANVGGVIASLAPIVVVTSTTSRRAANIALLNVG